MTAHDHALPNTGQAAGLAGRAMTVLRRHGLFLSLLAGGIALRIATQFAYRPAILYIDSYRYLLGAYELSPARNQPLGYALFIRPLLDVFDTLAVIPAVNHLLGLGMAGLIYAVLLRKGAWRWLAALASAPVLLDAYQLQIEQMIMSDTLFQAMLVAAFALLVWRRRPTLRVAATCGLLLGFAVWVRLVGQPLIIPAVAYLLLVGGVWRHRLANVAVCAVAFAAPLLGYAGWHAAAGGGYQLTYQTSYVLYARVAPLVDCTTLRMPAYERPLCPDRPVEQRPNEDWYFWESPMRSYEPPAGMDKQQVLRDFALRVVRQQPAAVAEAVGWDYLKSFAWQKRTFGNDLPVSRWQFTTGYPTYGIYADVDYASQAVAYYGGFGPAVTEPLTHFLRGYQLGVGYTPGPLLFVGGLAAILAALGVGRASASGLRVACLVWTMAGVGVVLVSDLYEFSWRYQLPALVLLPVAGVLGITALARRPPPGGARDAEPASRQDRHTPSGVHVFNAPLRDADGRRIRGG